VFEPSAIYLGLPVQHWRNGYPKRVKVENVLYILCSSSPRPAGARQYYSSSGDPGGAHKSSTDIRHMLSRFLQSGEAKCLKFWPKFQPRSYSDRRIFEPRRFIGKPKQTCQGPMIGLSPHQTWGWSVPQLWDPLAQWVPQKGKSGKFLIYHPFQRPTLSTAPPMLYHLVDFSCCKKTTVLHLPIRRLHFTGSKNQQPQPPMCTSINLAPRHISATVRARNLKFYTDIDRTKCSFRAWKFPLGGARGCSAP